MGGGAEGVLEGLQLALRSRCRSRCGDVRMVPAVAELLVEDLEEDAEDGVAPADAVGLAVDVEQDDVDVAVDGALDVAGEHGVLDLAVEELDGALGLSPVGDRAVFQQVGEDLQEVGLAGAEEAGDPDADLAGDVRIAGLSMACR